MPQPRAPALEQAAAEARRAREMAGRLVLESAARLAEKLSDADVEAAASEANEQAAEIVAGLPAMADALLADWTCTAGRALRFRPIPATRRGDRDMSAARHQPTRGP